MTGGGAQARRGKCAGYVLAGGASSRFGSDKALAQIGGVPMLLRMTALLEEVTGGAEVIAPAGRYAELGVRVVPDRWPGEGPLGGIATALSHAGETLGRREWAIILGCDLPYVSREWLEFLAATASASSAQAVVPVTQNGAEPLCACYRVTAGCAIAEMMGRGVRKITTALAELRTETLDEGRWKRFDTAGRLFLNMNTAADYQEIRPTGTATPEER